MASLKRRRESPFSSTEQSPLLPFATNINASSSISVPLPRRSSAPIPGQSPTDPVDTPYAYRDYSPAYRDYSPAYSRDQVKRQRTMNSHSPYPQSSRQEYAMFSSTAYDPSMAISSLPTPAPTMSGPMSSYASAYSVSPMPPSSMSGYPTPSTTYSQASSVYPAQASPASPYGTAAYYEPQLPLGFAIEPPVSEQQVRQQRRQQQNRDAQKRFREKKKATAAEKDARLSELEKELEEANEENGRICAENEALKRALQAVRQSQLGRSSIGGSSNAARQNRAAGSGGGQASVRATKSP